MQWFYRGAAVTAGALVVIGIAALGVLWIVNNGPTSAMPPQCFVGRTDSAMTLQFGGVNALQQCELYTSDDSGDWYPIAHEPPGELVCAFPELEDGEPGLLVRDTGAMTDGRAFCDHYHTTGD